MPPGSDDYKNAFYDVIAQFGGGGQAYINIGEEYERLTQSQILTEIENLSVLDKEALQELYEEDFLDSYYDEKSEKYIYDDDDLSQAVKGRFKCWIDDNFNLDAMLHEDFEGDENEENDEDDEYDENDENDENDEGFKIITENLKNVVLAILENATSQQLNARSIALLSKSLLAIECLPEFIPWEFPLYIYIKNDTPERRVYRKLFFSADGIEVGTEYSISGDGRWELIFEFSDGMSPNDLDFQSLKKIIEWSRQAIVEVSKKSKNVDIDYFGEPLGWDIFDERIEADEEDEEIEDNEDDEDEKDEEDEKDKDEENEGDETGIYILKNYKDEDVYVTANSLGKFNLQPPQDLAITINQITATLKTPLSVYFFNEKELYVRPIMAKSCFVLWVIDNQGKKCLEKLDFYPSFEETIKVTKGWNIIYLKGPRSEIIDAQIRYMLEYQAKLKKLRDEKT